MHSLKESDFTNFRLENGLKIWSALWEYRHPEVACFTATARPRPAVAPPRRGRRAAQQFGDVFMGGGKQGGPRELGLSGPEVGNSCQVELDGEVGNSCQVELDGGGGK